MNTNVHNDDTNNSNDLNKCNLIDFVENNMNNFPVPVKETFSKKRHIVSENNAAYTDDSIMNKLVKSSPAELIHVTSIENDVNASLPQINFLTNSENSFSVGD